MVSAVAASRNPMDSLSCLRSCFGIPLNTTKLSRSAYNSTEKYQPSEKSGAERSGGRQPLISIGRLNAMGSEIFRKLASWARRLRTGGRNDVQQAAGLPQAFG